MGRFVKLKLDKDIDIEEFLDFLNFHQFNFETEEEEVFNFNTMTNEKELNFLIPEDGIEEFKVMTLIYKDLQESKLIRNLNIPIENSAIDYEKTRRINVVELTKNPVKDENDDDDDTPLFVKEKKEEKNSNDQSMEDSFYGNKNKKNEKKIVDAFLENEVFKEEENKVESEKKQSSFLKDFFKIIILLVIIGILAGMYMLIR